MRLSSLVFAAVLSFSSTVFAQRPSSSSAPTSPPPAPAPTPAPSVSSSASPSHSSASSSPSPSASPSPSPASSSMGSHSSAASTPAPSHVPSSVSPSPSAGSSSRPTAHSPESEPGRVIPERKLPGDEGRIVPAQRIGSTPPPQQHEPKAAEPDLRRRICDNGPCKELPVQPPANPDLRRRICKDGPCVECPPGQSAGKNGGCVATPAPTTNTISHLCQPNETWHGAACVATYQCRPGEFWNGAQCTNRTAECANTDARAAMLAHEVRTTRMDMDAACVNHPSGQQCRSLKQSYDFAVQRYRILLNEAPVACRSMLLDPLSL